MILEFRPVRGRMGLAVAADRFLPDPSLSREEMEQLQRGIADAAVFRDRHGWAVDDKELVVAGVDQAFLDAQAVSGVVVMRDGQVVELVSAVVDLEIPYIPGLLAFREGGSIVAALQELETEPDVVLFDGSGRIHFREAGLATHMGVLFDAPSVGVAKSLLCGAPDHALDAPLPAGEQVAIRADDSVETADAGTVIGAAYQSRQYDDTAVQHVNPLYVSPGHRVSAETAVAVVERCCNEHKLPEPVHRADRYVADVKHEV